MNEDVSRPTDSRVKRTLKNLTAFGIGCAVVAVIGEVTIRVLDLPPKPLPPLNVDTYRLASNPIIKFEYRPEYAPEATPYHESMTGFRINSAGFRDREFSVSKSKGVRRIIVLGDSITAGHGIAELDRVYPRRLEALMNEKDAGIRTEVLNMGVGGYNTLQEVETLRVKGLDYNPDVVIVGFCVNDFSWEASPFTRLIEQLEPRQREILGDMQWENRAWLNALISRSRLALFVFANVQGFRGDRERSYDLDDYSISGTDPVSMALPILSDLQKKHGFECFLFIIPAFDDEFNRYGHSHIHNRLRSVAAPYPNIQLIDLFDDFATSNEHPSELAWDGLHPTAKGQDLLARYIQRYLKAPETASRAGPKQGFYVIKNGSFEVFNTDSFRAASWYYAPAELTPIVRSDAAAAHGSHAVELHGVENSWSVFAQELELMPEDYGKTLVVSAYGKTPAAQNMYLEIEWQIGEERFTEHSPWPASPGAYTRVEVRAAIPPEAEGSINRVKIIIRPGSGTGYFVDHIEAKFE